MNQEKIGEIIKSLNKLLYEDISVHAINDELEIILDKIDMMGLSIVVAESIRFFAFFEWNNGVITAHLYKRINHLLIKNLIEKYNMRKRNARPQ